MVYSSFNQKHKLVRLFICLFSGRHQQQLLACHSLLPSSMATIVWNLWSPTTQNTHTHSWSFLQYRSRGLRCLVHTQLSRSATGSISVCVSIPPALQCGCRWCSQKDAKQTRHDFSAGRVTYSHTSQGTSSGPAKLDMMAQFGHLVGNGEQTTGLYTSNVTQAPSTGYNLAHEQYLFKTFFIQYIIWKVGGLPGDIK